MRRLFAMSVLAPAALFAASQAAAAQSVSVGTRSTGDSVIFLRITPSSPRASTLSRERLDSLHRVLSLMENQVVGTPAWTGLQNRVTAILNDLSEQSTADGPVAPVAPRELLPRLFSSGALAPRTRDVAPRGWIGLSLDGPHDATITADGEAVHYFEYPLIVSVDPNSPADRSGISSGDLLLAYDGADVRQSWINMTRLLQPDRKITVTVRRDGQTKRYPLTVDTAPPSFIRRIEVLTAAPSAPMLQPGTPLPPFAANALFGATLSDVTPELSAALSIPSGVLVNAAPAESPAYEGGLRVGDVVTAVGGTRIASVNQFRRAAFDHARDRQLTLQVRRKGDTRQITLRW